METQTKLRKKSITVVERAMHEVRGFRKLYEELDDKVRLSGQSESTLKNYGRKLAQLSLHFGKLPQNVAEKEMNRYLASLARNSKSPSLSDFKFAVYGLRYCYRLLGIGDKIVNLPQIRRSNKLPVVLNYQECKALFQAPDLLKHRVLLALMYSGGLRAREVSRLKLSDVEYGMDIVSIKELLGHERIETTLIYLHVARPNRTNLFSPLDRLYEDTGNRG